VCSSDLVLTYTVTLLPVSGSLSLGSGFTQSQIDAGSLSYSHDGSEQLSDSFSFSVSDGNGGTLPETVFAISVTPVNDPPVLGLTALPDAQAEQFYSVSFSPSDPDAGDVLTVSVVSGPGWLDAPVDNGDGSWTLGGTPQVADAGSATLTLRVSDDGTPIGSQDVSLPLLVLPPGVPVPSLGPVGLTWLWVCMLVATRFGIRKIY
ncbi:MAG: cadherin-like domain-containing protein, partial [Myxococcota bacterium]